MAAIAAWFGKLRQALVSRFSRRPIATTDDLVEFIETRSAHIAQTSLYGYLKTRMGTQYPAFFEDDAFAGSINIAKSRLIVACIADLTVHAVGLATRHRALAREDCDGLARLCFGTAVERTAIEAGLDIAVEEAKSRFSARIGDVQWPVVARGEDAFVESPVELFDAAPIAEELKQYDRGIVTNSIRFRWREPRAELRERLDAAALWQHWADNREQFGR